MSFSPDTVLSPVGFNFGIPLANSPPNPMGPPLFVLLMPLVTRLELLLSLLAEEEELPASPFALTETETGSTSDPRYPPRLAYEIREPTADHGRALVYGDGFLQRFPSSDRLEEQTPVLLPSARARRAEYRRRRWRWCGHPCLFSFFPERRMLLRKVSTLGDGPVPADYENRERQMAQWLKYILRDKIRPPTEGMLQLG